MWNVVKVFLQGAFGILLLGKGSLGVLIAHHLAGIVVLIAFLHFWKNLLNGLCAQATIPI